MSDRTPYDGAVCYIDGDHYALDDDGQPVDQRLYLVPEENQYYEALEDDPAYHDRFHEKFVDVEMEDGQPGARVSPAEFEAIQQLLGQLREGE